MSDTELCYLTAEQARLRFENRSLSPIELMQALIDRSEQGFTTPSCKPDRRISPGGWRC